MKPLTDQRAIAALCLQRLIKERLSLPLILQDACESLEEKRRPLVHELCYGACRYYPQLEAIVSAKLQKPLRGKDNDVHQLLIIGAYQLLYMRLAEHAVVSETINALKPMAKVWANGMANAILRGIQREQETIVDTLKPQQQRALPLWLDERISTTYSTAQHQTIAEAFKTSAPLTLRVNHLQQTTNSYLDTLTSMGVSARSSNMVDSAIILDQACDVSSLPGFDTGACSVQDEAAQLSAQLLLANKPTKILDACAAPGGKTCHILERSGNSIKVTALDNDAKRLARVQENLDRLKLSATLICADAADTESWWNKQKFDAILLDAPCSATGVIRRNPDIKVLRTEDDAKAMPSIQLAILDALWQTLADNGLMVYATCSILVAENDKVIAKALKAHDDMTVEIIEADWGMATPYGRQLLPTINGSDGFYYACLRKRAGSV